MSRDQEMIDGSCVLNFDSDKAQKIEEYFTKLKRQAKRMQDYFISDGFDEISEPMHYIHLNIQSIINICEGVLTAIYQVQMEMKKQEVIYETKPGR